MKHVCDLLKMTNCNLIKNSWKKISQSHHRNIQSLAIEILQKSREIVN